MSRLVRGREGPGRHLLTGRGIHALAGRQCQDGDRGLFIAVDPEGLQQVQIGVIPGRARSRE